MKFNTITILGLAYIMMLMGAHVLAIREKVSFSRTSHRHRRIRKGRKAHSKTKLVMCVPEPGFSSFNFFFAAITTAIGSLEGQVLQDIKAAVEENPEICQ